MLRLALACGLLALLVLPLHEPLSVFFAQAMAWCLPAALVLALGDATRAAMNGWRFFLTGRES